MGFPGAGGETGGGGENRLVRAAWLPSAFMPTDPWRNRARKLAARIPDGLRPSGDNGRPRHVVCGGDQLTYRLVSELLTTSDVHVTLVMPRRRRPEEGLVAGSRGFRRLTAERLDAATFRAAGLESAEALALMHADDVGNLHAALCAKEVNPRIRLVIRMFNPGLAESVRHLLDNCAVLSDSAMAAPAFVAAALGEVTPTTFQLFGRTLIVAWRTDVDPRDVVCGLAAPGETSRPHVLPADEDRADLVLAQAGNRPAGTELAARRLRRQRRRRRPLAALLWLLGTAVNRTIAIALLVTLGVVVVAGGVLTKVDGLDAWDSFYLTLLTAISGAEPELEPNGTLLQEICRIVLTVGGLALVPLITALVVDAVVNARLVLDARRLRVPRQDHVIVIGMGNVGTGVIRQLHALDVDVVAIDNNPAARGVSVARRLGIPFIEGDAADEATLQQAWVESAQALVVLSTDDVTNLQAAINGRQIRPGLRVVLRLFDGDFADRVQQAFSIDVSRSVSYLAAPAFAARMVGQQEVVASIPVARHVLLVAEVPVAAGSDLDGAPVSRAARSGQVRVIGLVRFGEPRPFWSPPATLLIFGRDRLLVVARRAGLAWLQEQAAEPQDDPDPAELPAD